MALAGPRIVVAMTTCDGERFLQRQLESIGRQTRLPDAMVVSDDASQDGTLSILEQFRLEARFPVSILRNESRQGVHRNSDCALAHAATLGEIVIPCDHDDVWDPEKVEALEAAFADDPRIVLWFSDAELIDEYDKPLGVSLSEFVSLDDQMVHEIAAGGGLRRLTHGATISGGTTAVRSWVIPHAVPTPRVMLGENPGFHQDGWLVLVARLLGEFAADDRRLLRYRRHSSQLSHRDRSDGQLARDPDARGRYMHHERTRVGLIAERVRRDVGAPWVAERSSMILALDQFLGVRIMRPGQPGRRGAVLRELRAGAYRRFVRGWRTAARDLLLPTRPPRADGSGAEARR